MSNLQSVPLRDGQRVQRTSPTIHWERLPLVLIGTFLLLLWWAAGAKYTIDGLPLFGNEILAFFRAPQVLPSVTDWHWYLWLCWLPLGISLAERKYAPWRRLTLSVIMIWVLAVWFVVSGLDAGSTWLAVTHPSADAYTVSKQIAAIKPLAAVWSLMTTFLPEIGISLLWLWLRKG